MYRLLLRHLPRPYAVALSALWYAGLLALAAYGAFEPQAEFQYLVM